jgi:hypothetical protein
VTGYERESVPLIDLTGACWSGLPTPGVELAVRMRITESQAGGTRIELSGVEMGP